MDRGSGPTVLLLHGQPGTGASWDPVTDLLADRLPGPRPGPPGLRRHHRGGPGAGRQRRLRRRPARRAAGGGPATVVAHSWAGGAAVLLADRRPDLVAGLVLVGAACTPDSLDAVDRLLALPVVGDALTVAGLLALGEVLPRVAAGSRHGCRRACRRPRSGRPCPTRACWAASVAPSGATGGRS